MKFFIFSFLSFLFVIGNISGQEGTNQLNEKGERIGHWAKYYDNGKIRYQGQFENGKEIGVFKFYSLVSSEHPIIIKTFSKVNNLAQVEFYSEQGVLESKGTMNGEKRVGQWVFYHLDGTTIVSEENYENGLLNGISKTYYRSGEVTEILFYKNGKLEGNIKRFSDEGILLDDLIYKNGKLNGLAKYYNTNGKLILTGVYENDEKVGDWQYFGDEEINSVIKKQ